MKFNGFKQEGLDLLDEIELNNTKEWFEANRHRWQEHILEPNKAYVNEMGEHLIALAPFIRAEAKAAGSLFRIYRDTRFSKDKTPIKTKIGVIFWQGSGHRMKSPCFYMQYKSHEVLIGTGIRVFKDELLQKYREYIKIENNARELHRILIKIQEHNFSLKEAYYKRTPTGFDKESPYAYLAHYNGIFAYKTFKPNKTFLSTRIINYNFKFYDNTLELFNWLDNFIKS